MSGSLSHCFIEEASSLELRRAWSSWTGGENLATSVHFIQASNGCFVVTLGEVLRSEASRSWLPVSLTRKHVPAVERFKAAYEHGELNRLGWLKPGAALERT